MNHGKVSVPFGIPGFITEFELAILSHLAKYIPKNKQILEIGSLFGRSANALLMNSDESVVLNSIDTFDTYPEIKKWTGEHYSYICGSNERLKTLALQKTLESKSFLEGFNHFTVGYQKSKRLNLIIGDSQKVKFDKKVELMFIDADHFILHKDIKKFYNNVNGVICCHDLDDTMEYGHKIFESLMKSSRQHFIPWIVLPRTSLAFFCKTTRWRNIVFKAFDEATNYINNIPTYKHALEEMK